MSPVNESTYILMPSSESVVILYNGKALPLYSAPLSASFKSSAFSGFNEVFCFATFMAWSGDNILRSKPSGWVLYVLIPFSFVSKISIPSLLKILYSVSSGFLYCSHRTYSILLKAKYIPEIVQSNNWIAMKILKYLWIFLIFDI